MSDRGEIEALIARVEAATGPDKALDAQIADAFGVYEPVSGNAAIGYVVQQYTASLDAIVGLIERELPGWRWDIHSPRNGQQFEAVLMTSGESRRVIVEHAPTPALAICLAFLRALHSKEQP